MESSSYHFKLGSVAFTVVIVTIETFQIQLFDQICLMCVLIYKIQTHYGTMTIERWLSQSQTSIFNVIRHISRWTWRNLAQLGRGSKMRVVWRNLAPLHFLWKCKLAWHGHKCQWKSQKSPLKPDKILLLCSSASLPQKTEHLACLRRKHWGNYTSKRSALALICVLAKLPG